MIEHILALTILIIAVIILRGLFGKRISKRFLYAMWLVVALKLLIPVPMISNNYHVMNLIYSVAEQNQSGSIKTTALSMSSQYQIRQHLFLTEKNRNSIKANINS